MNERKVLSEGYHYDDLGGTGPIMSGSSPVITQGSYRVRTGTVTAGFRSIPRRDLPVNNYYDHRYDFRQPVIPHVLTYYYGSLQSHVHGGFSAGDCETMYTNGIIRLEGSMRSHADIVNELKLKLLLKIADTKTNVAVSLKEASKTSDLILDVGKRLLEAYRAFRKGNLKKVAENLNISPGRAHKSWLEYKYGWMPLLMDIKGAAEFFAQQSLGGRAPTFSVSTSYKDDGRYLDEYTTFPYSGGQRGEMTRSYHASALVELTNQHLSELQQIGLTNPALYVWETIPFSFCFDWMCSVGDWLTGLSALHGVSVKRAMVSWVRDVSVTHDVSVAPQGNPSVGSYTAPFGQTVFMRGRPYVREILLLDPWAIYPPVQNPISSFSRLVTGLALIRSTGRRLG